MGKQCSLMDLFFPSITYKLFSNENVMRTSTTSLSSILIYKLFSNKNVYDNIHHKFKITWKGAKGEQNV